MFVTNWIATTKIQKISEIPNFFRHYFLSRTEVASSVSTHAEAAVRPDFSILFYPVISMDERISHKGSCVKSKENT